MTGAEADRHTKWTKGIHLRENQKQQQMKLHFYWLPLNNTAEDVRAWRRISIEMSHCIPTHLWQLPGLQQMCILHFLFFTTHALLINSKGRKEVKWRQSRIILICILFIQTCSYDRKHIFFKKLLTFSMYYTIHWSSHTPEEGLASLKNNSI